MEGAAKDHQEHDGQVAEKQTLPLPPPLRLSDKGKLEIQADAAALSIASFLLSGLCFPAVAKIIIL